MKIILKVYRFAHEKFNHKQTIKTTLAKAKELFVKQNHSAMNI